MIRCHHCGTENLEGAAYCDECGAHLVSGASEESASGKGDREKVWAGPRPRAKLVLLRGGRRGREFPILESEVMIGRWDAEQRIFPEIDLEEDDPEAKVSRRHARILYREGRFWIEDLGSLNGTFVNRGPRLRPGQMVPLQHGDEIILGKIFLRFLIEGV